MSLIRILVALVLFTLPAHAQDKVALVIGNASYKNASALANPVNDARAVAEKLTSIGFEVALYEDLSGQAFRVALGAFSEKALNADLAIVFYAGHAIEMQGKNYLIPIDAEMKSEATAQFETITLDQMLQAVRSARQLGMVMLDACRNNPFATTMVRSNGTRGDSRGLASVSVEGETGLVVSFAAEAGNTADDGDGSHSPYTSALLEVLDQPGLEVGRMFRSVRAKVKTATNGKQVPIEQMQLPDQDIYLVAGTAPAPVIAATTTTASADPAPAPADDPLLIYLAALKSGDRAAIEDFIRRYPDHPRAVDARAVVADIAETDFWADTLAKNTEAGFRTYLLGFPQGRYSVEATNRIAALAIVPEPIPVPQPDPAPDPVLAAAPDRGSCPVQTGEWSVKGIATDDTLFVRSGPGTSNAEIGELAYNATGISVTACEGKWCEVQYGCIAGFASAKYLTDDDVNAASSDFSGVFSVVDHPANEKLNIRSGPGEQYDVVAELAHDATGVMVTDCQTVDNYDYRWCNLAWNQVSGWGYGRYLQDSQGQKPLNVTANNPDPKMDAVCYNLWFQRNAIFYANGYCFTSEQGLAEFDDGTCHTSAPVLTAGEKERLEQIKVEEKKNGCLFE